MIAHLTLFSFIYFKLLKYFQIFKQFKTCRVRTLNSFTPYSTVSIVNFEMLTALYLSVFRSNAGKYGPEKTPCLDTFHAVATS